MFYGPVATEIMKHKCIAELCEIVDEMIGTYHAGRQAMPTAINVGPRFANTMQNVA